MNNYTDREKTQMLLDGGAFHKQQIQKPLKNMQRLLFQRVTNKLLDINSGMLNKFIQLNKIKEQIQLYKFMVDEQKIMNNQLTNQKIPELIENINQLKLTKQKKLCGIEQLDEKMKAQNSVLQRLKQKTVSKYEKKRKQQQKTQTICKQIQKYKQCYENMGKDNDERVNRFLAKKCQKNFCGKLIFSGLQREIQNKQNLSQKINTYIEKPNISNQQKNGCFSQRFQNQQILRLVNLRTNKGITEMKVKELTDKVKDKIKRLNQKKNEKKKMIEKLGDRIKNGQTQKKHFQISVTNFQGLSSTSQNSPGQTFQINQ